MAWQMRRSSWIALWLSATVMAGCALQPETAPLDLRPAADSPVWPPAPELPRYAYAGTLIGEENFLAPNQNVNSAKSAVAWLVGLVVGEPELLELLRPVGGMVDEAGRILVADVSHHAIVVFDQSAQKVQLWRQAERNLTFDTPVAVCGSRRHGYWVTDAEHGEVFRLDAEGVPVARFGADIVRRPTGIACDFTGQRLFVADTAAHDIKVFDLSGQLIDTIGRRGTNAWEFNAPVHLAYADGQLVVADTLNFRVQILGLIRDSAQLFGKIGLYVGNMTRPKGVAIGEGGRIYVVESYYDHLLVFDKAGRFLLPIGGTGKTAGRFYLPVGVWTDGTGRVYVADTFNGRISVFQELTTEGRR